MTEDDRTLENLEQRLLEEKELLQLRLKDLENSKEQLIKNTNHSISFVSGELRVLEYVLKIIHKLYGKKKYDL